METAFLIILTPLVIVAFICVYWMAFDIAREIIKFVKKSMRRGKMKYILTRNEDGTYTVTDGGCTYNAATQREAIQIFAALAEKNGGDDNGL